jgi:hypothetical protein
MPNQTKLHLKRLLTTTVLACFGLLTLAPPRGHSATKNGGVVVQPHIVTCNFKQTPLRTALKGIYRGSGYEYSVLPDVPDVKITLKIKKLPLRSAIRQFVRTVKKLVPQFHVDMDTQLFVYKLRSLPE